jgi:hypothetical protein
MGSINPGAGSRNWVPCKHNTLQAGTRHIFLMVEQNWLRRANVNHVPSRLPLCSEQTGLQLSWMVLPLLQGTQLHSLLYQQHRHEGRWALQLLT